MKFTSLGRLGLVIVLMVILWTGCSYVMYNTRFETSSSELYKQHEEECNADIEYRYMRAWKQNPGSDMKFWDLKDTTATCMEAKGWKKIWAGAIR
jgi:uncharacterized protein YceK